VLEAGIFRPQVRVDLEGRGLWTYRLAKESPVCGFAALVRQIRSQRLSAPVLQASYRPALKVAPG
jgi:hypothetical protein